jgi:hypothetical protein
VNQVLLGVLTEETHTNETGALREWGGGGGPARGRPMEVQRCDTEPSESEAPLRRPKPRVSWPAAAKPKSVGRTGVKATGSV